MPLVLGWTSVVAAPGRRSNVSSHWEQTDATAEGELVNLISMSTSHNVLLLCPDKVQLAQQLRCLTWAVLGVSPVREKRATPGAGKEGLGLGQSLICSKNVHLCHCMFWYVGVFSSFLLLPPPCPPPPFF